MWPAKLDAAAALAGRVLLSAIFLHEAYAKLTAYGMSQAYMRAFGVHADLLPFAIAAVLLGGVQRIIGQRHHRLGRRFKATPQIGHAERARDR